MKNTKLFPESGNIHVRKRVKFGIDPTSPNLHLGHFVPLRIVKKLQDMKKNVTIIIGTFTAMLGDPTGQEKTRPILSQTQVMSNAARISEQVLRVLPDVEIIPNHKLLEQIPVTTFLIEAASKFTLAEIMARESFQNRPLGLHELLVPLCQAMDSVLLETEIEVGGEDQQLNFSLTRKLQTEYKQTPEICLMAPIITGTDGRKMSKSLNNCIFLNDSADTIRDKVNHTQDAIVRSWFPILTDREIPENPVEMKIAFVDDIITQLW